ncbi:MULTISPECIES: hypothetical protein [unclassified Bacillus (in: firmicutes)]|uniref:hypothetical protein n=1 Tax=Bacillaceae TaxID=186817 RepID=UPI000BF12E77|nr:MULTISPECIES: hypothetical protein [unclassified Bacillus (in: firmicutes)]PEJ48532.1 hypothetical protein CN692_24075 [Bacillus sp. AFS002410]PEK99901.1 hypothetical protein CN601_22870 [Bacillus sp. AFS017336]QKE71939.1 hypothetical protein HPK19_03580 [Arthrobacter citreus]
MYSMSYDVLKSDILNTLTNVQNQLNSEDYSVHTKEQLQSQLEVYQYVDELSDMHYFYKSGY